MPSPAPLSLAGRAEAALRGGVRGLPGGRQPGAVSALALPRLPLLAHQLAALAGRRHAQAVLLAPSPQKLLHLRMLSARGACTQQRAIPILPFEQLSSKRKLSLYYMLFLLRGMVRLQTICV